MRRAFVADDASGLVPLDKSPEVLRERGREILAQAGYDKKPADTLFEFDSNYAYLKHTQSLAQRA